MMLLRFSAAAYPPVARSVSGARPFRIRPDPSRSFASVIPRMWLERQLSSNSLAASGLTQWRDRVETAPWDFRDRPLDRDILQIVVRISRRLLSLNFCLLGEFSEGQLSKCSGHPTGKSSPLGLGRLRANSTKRQVGRLYCCHRPFASPLTGARCTAAIADVHRLWFRRALSGYCSRSIGNQPVPLCPCGVCAARASPDEPYPVHYAVPPAQHLF
jgi:hypothetical protein